MKLFRDRHDNDLFKELRQKLTLDGDDGAIKKALPVSQPFAVDGQTFTHCIRVDFVGITATLLFDTGHNVAPEDINVELMHLLREALNLNKRGYFVRVRLLFLYPYSLAGHCRIQAECSPDRAAMNEPAYKRAFQMVEQVNEDTFKMSALVSMQHQVLDHIEDRIKELNAIPDWNKFRQNEIVVRFAPVWPSINAIFVNDSVFYDSYVLAKELRNKRLCAQVCPLTRIDRADGRAFLALEDHFRYLWELDVTLDAEDATFFGPGVPRGLSRVREPRLVTFDNKAERIRNKTPELTDADSAHWKSCARGVLNRYCPPLSPTPASESAFITCSWKQEDDGRSTPNQNAKDVSEWLLNDFSTREAPLLSVRIMEGVPGDWLTQQLYSALNDTTIGIVLITRDIKCGKERFLARPNVYHELGYLMSRIGKERIFLLVEHGADIPSNVNDVVRVPFAGGKLMLVYDTLVDWLVTRGALPVRAVTVALTNTKDRIEKALVDGSLTPKEGRATIKRIGQRLPKK